MSPTAEQKLEFLTSSLKSSLRIFKKTTISLFKNSFHAMLKTLEGKPIFENHLSHLQIKGSGNFDISFFPHNHLHRKVQIFQ